MVNRLRASSKIYVEQSQIPNAGRGVFALKNISAGEIVETCPVIILHFSDTKTLNSTILGNYYFRWGEGYEQIAIAMGFGSFYNHSYSPNALYKTNLENAVIDFIALKPISPDEEITFNYNGDPNNQSPNWNFT